ncbi:MAG: ATP-binding domain-containing protein, partial [Vicinamibacterales bacterium]
AVTAHRSQGQSVDEVVIAGETMKRELFYVAASRGREHLTVITSDQARLEASIAQSGARQSACELVRTAHARFADGLPSDASRGFARGIRAVVEGTRWSVGFERDSQRDAVLVAVQQPASHASGHEGGAPVPPLERGHDYGISR